MSCTCLGFVPVADLYPCTNTLVAASRSVFVFSCHSCAPCVKAERYKGLMDAKDRDDLPNAGKVIILPPSVTGSPRWYVEQLQDALAIVRQYGKPTVFLTLTCNPEWSEITDSLEDGERWSDRPDIVARVFRAKLRAMMDLLTKGKLLGDPVYWVYSIEWQKRRGLPHCHLLRK